MADKIKYKFSDKSSGTIIYNEGYTALVIIDRIAEVNAANADQIRLAIKHGGIIVPKNKTAKKPAKSETKDA